MSDKVRLINGEGSRGRIRCVYIVTAEHFTSFHGTNIL